MEAIKVNEIRIGNLINPCNKYVKEAIITTIHENGNIKYYGGTYKIEKNIKDIKPIPLTEEWLDNNCIKKVKQYEGCHTWSFGFLCVRLNGNQFELMNDSVSNAQCYFLREINYLHELQNGIYFLTGSELVRK